VKEEIIRNSKLRAAVVATAGVVVAGLVASEPVRAESKSKKVDKITCEDFLAMNPEAQQRIAYWVDGYRIAKGESAVGTVAFDKFGMPQSMTELVADCKTSPKDTIWEKIKKHL
jgi:HdeA/HdeB family